MMATTSRFILPLLIPLLLAFTTIQDGDSHSIQLDKKAPHAQKLPAPAGCKKLPIDADWPSPDVVNSELPGWEASMPDGDKKHPNYVYEVKTVSSVQRAVRFAANHNIRLSIINTGHDFLGRYDYDRNWASGVNKQAEMMRLQECSWLYLV
jgi:hypothetical protein